MKKFVVLSLAGLLIFALGGTGFAQDLKLDFRASGSIDVQTHYSKNVPPLNPNATPIFNSLPADYRMSSTTFRPDRALDKRISYWDSRMSLRFDAVMGKELSATLQFEIDAGRFGGAPTGIANNVRDANNVGYWSTDRTAIEVKYMYFDVGLPYFGIPVPMTVRAGAQPFVIRPWFLQATDGTGISGGIKIDPVNINPLYFKPMEGTDWAADDVDVYGLQANAKIATFTLGGYGLFYNMNSYPMFVASAVAGFYPGFFPQLNGTQKANFWWLGFYADGKAGPVDVQFDVGYDGGKVESKLTRFTATGLPIDDVKYSGWATRIKVDFPWEKFNFGVVGMYASGSDANKTSSTGLPGTSTAGDPTRLSSKVKGWMVPVGSENGAANAESAVFYGMEAGASGGQGWAVNHNYNQTSKGAFGGTWFAKLYGSYKVTPWYKVTLQGLYIGDTTKNGNTFGTRVDFLGRLENDKSIGWEVDMMNEIYLYKNLTFKVFGGYLWAGKALDLYSGSPIAGNHGIQNPWAIRTRFIYTF